jgi:hypothetical protein
LRPGSDQFSVADAKPSRTRMITSIIYQPGTE